jgi:outer membrane protein assembly factor BamB
VSQVAVALTLLLVFVSTLSADNWPAWRGADGTGISNEQNLPIHWSATGREGNEKAKDIRWNVPLPEPCNSTPIVWKNRIFLTQGLDKGRRRALLTLDRQTGETIWQRELLCDTGETSHRQNPPCSSSPVTDGKLVYAWFASAGLVAFDFEGNKIWHRDLGPVLSHWGNASSPVVYDDLLFVFHGPGTPSIFYAFDKRTGETVWKSQECDINRNIFGSWSTPFLLRGRNRDELIMPFPGTRVGGVGWFKAFTPRSGEVLWQCDGLGNEIYAMPIVGHDQKVIVGISGHNGPMLAVRPGGSGNVTSSHRLWRIQQKTPERISSGIIHDGHLYIANVPGIMECLNVETGESVWRQRLGGNLWGSILMGGDNLYVSNIEGDTFVVRAQPQFRLVAKNSVGEPTYATLAPSDDEWFLRTHEHLYCIANE